MSEEIQALRKINKKGLGRGLGSLLGELGINDVSSEPGAILPDSATASSAIEQKGERVLKIAIEKIRPNVGQPRKQFDRLKLDELAQSIKSNGIILPIVARKSVTNEYEIIAGERRWRAAQLAGLKEVPVIVREAENKETLELALIENIQRHDLNALEEAEAYSLLATKYALTQQQIAEKVGKDRATVANLLRLIHLAPDVKSLVRAGDLQLGQAKVLLAVSNPGLQTQLAKKAVQLRLSVRAVEKMVSKALGSGQNEIEGSDELSAVKQLRQELQQMIGTKVAIQSVGKTRTLSFTFYSDEELNQFVEKLRKTMR